MQATHPLLMNWYRDQQSPTWSSSAHGRMGVASACHDGWRMAHGSDGRGESGQRKLMAQHSS